MQPPASLGQSFVTLLQTLESGRAVSFCSCVCLVGCPCLLQLHPANIQASFSWLNKQVLFFKIVYGAVTVTCCQHEPSKRCLAGAEPCHRCHTGNLCVHNHAQA